MQPCCHQHERTVGHRMIARRRVLPSGESRRLDGRAISCRCGRAPAVPTDSPRTPPSPWRSSSLTLLDTDCRRSSYALASAADAHTPARSRKAQAPRGGGLCCDAQATTRIPRPRRRNREGRATVRCLPSASQLRGPARLGTMSYVAMGSLRSCRTRCVPVRRLSMSQDRRRHCGSHQSPRRGTHSLCSLRLR